MKLVLGVVDVAYSNPGGSDGAKTTHEVAEILESKYHPMETFFWSRKDQIAEALADGMAATLQLVINGQIPDARSSPTYSGDQKIEAMFKAFLDANEMALLVAGLAPFEPAAGASSLFGLGASQKVTNSRKLIRSSKKHKTRPAFIDTGLYRASFRAWTTRAE